MLVAANKQLYVTLPKRQKMLLSRSIVHAVRSQNPPGRFLQKDGKTDFWYDIGDQKAQEKTSQALREGAPELRSKIKEDNKPPSATKSISISSSAAQESRSDEGVKSPVPSATSTVADDTDGPSSRPPSRTTSGSVSAPQLAQQSSGNSIGQVLPPATPQFPATASLSPSAIISMPPPAMRPVDGSSQQLSQRYPEQRQMKHHYEEEPLQQQILLSRMRNGTLQALPQQAMNGGVVVQGQVNANDVNNQMNSVELTFPTKMYNHQGIMVPPPVMQEPPIPPPVPAQGPVSQRQYDQGIKCMKEKREMKLNGSKPDDLDQRNSMTDNLDHSQRSVQRQYQLPIMSHFDQTLEGMVLPPDGLEAGGLSFGSVGSGIMLTENEVKRLEAGGNSFGTMSNNNLNNNFNMAHEQQQQQELAQQQMLQQEYLQQQQQYTEQYQRMEQQQTHYQQQQQQMNLKRESNEEIVKAAPPPDDGLEPQGFSFGSVSLMSIGDAKLEPTGISFGSAMSFKMAPDMVDGGLEGIGMSFGSMTLATTAEEGGGSGPGGGSGGYVGQENQHSIIPLPPPGLHHKNSSDMLPTLFQQNRSSVNLLDCSDTESEDEEQSAHRSHHRSLEWEKMKALVDAGAVENNAHVQPSQLRVPQTCSFPSSFAIPNATSFQRDFSQMSALSVGDNDGDIHNNPNMHSIMAAVSAIPPPPPPQEQNDEDGEWQNAELLLLKATGNKCA